MVERQRKVFGGVAAIIGRAQRSIEGRIVALRLLVICSLSSLTRKPNKTLQVGADHFALPALMDRAIITLAGAYNRRSEKKRAMQQTDALQRPHQVVFYTKAGCHLCDEARDLLEELAEEITFELTETDIRSDMVIFEQYRYRIPVIIIDENATVEGRINLAELRRAFTRRQERS